MEYFKALCMLVHLLFIVWCSSALISEPRNISRTKRCSSWLSNIIHHIQRYLLLWKWHKWISALVLDCINLGCCHRFLISTMEKDWLINAYQHRIICNWVIWAVLFFIFSTFFSNERCPVLWFVLYSIRSYVCPLW